MSLPDPGAPADHPPHRVALLGGGVIGAGWAARMLLCGADVCLFDPAPGAAQDVREQVARARRAWSALTDVAPPAPGTLTLAGSVAEAVAGAELIQESAPEREGLKRELLAAADAAAPEGAIIASSTSGLRPSRLAADMVAPQRFVVAHPFNPVYLLPLVELCGGERTAPETIERAAALYRGVGMHPLVVRREIDGFIADRLLEALWREALWLVADDVATVAEVDDAIRFGAGLRWASMGTFLTYRLAGGQAGMRHFLEQFGPALALPWTKLVDVPDLDAVLIERIVTQSDAQAEGRSIDELARLRDDCLVAVLRGLRETGFGAGLDVAGLERAWKATATGPPPTLHEATATGLPPTLHEATVVEEWIDYNGHMTEHRWLEVLAGATDAFLELVGAGPRYAAQGRSYYTVETHLRHLGEAHAGDRLRVTTQLLHHDAKRLHLFHEIRRDAAGDPLATGEHMLIHVDTAAGRAVPVSDAVLAVVARTAEAQSGLAIPDAAGRAIGDPRPPAP